MSQMPEIKPVVNKEPERDKKKAGLLARLFGGGASGGFGGAGAGGGMGGLAGGGLLATKAGLLALILAGTTVAGGIGMVGYRLFGPGAEMTGNGDNLNLFASKPKETASADGQGAKDGTSASLQYLSQANATPKEADAAAAGAVKDATAAGATGSETAASSSGGTGPLNAAGSGGNGVSHGLLKNSGKFGAFSAPGGGGGGSSPVANSAPQKAPFDANAGTKGSLSASRKSAAASIGGGTSRSLAGKHFGGAVGQGFGVLGNQKGAQSSYAAGQTYDGAASGGSNIGANGTPIGGPGAVAGAGAAQPKSVAGPPTDQNTSTNVPTPPATPAAPWAKLLQTAEMLVGIAAALLMVCSMINKPPTHVSGIIAQILGGIVCALGVAIIAIGAEIASKWGQKQFGLIGLGVGGVLIALGADSLFTTAPPSADAVITKGVEPSAAAVKAALSSPGDFPPPTTRNIA